MEDCDYWKDLALELSTEVAKTFIGQENETGLLKQAKEESGGLFALIPRYIRAKLYSKEEYILNTELQRALKEVAIKMVYTSPEKFVSPKDFVAFPAIEAMTQTQDSAELRELYANLLAKSMHKDYYSLAHPSYVNIINQFSPLDALLFAKFFTHFKVLPYLSIARAVHKEVINFDYFKKGVSFNSRYHKRFEMEPVSVLVEYITEISEYEIDLVAISILNFKRLGLIETPRISTEPPDMVYEKIQQNPLYFKSYEQYTSEEEPPFYLTDSRGYFYLTEYGQSFYKICIENIKEA